MKIAKSLKKVFASLVIILIILSTLFALIVLFPSFHACRSAYYQDYNNQHYPKDLTRSYILLGNLVCSVDTVEKHDGLFSTLATIIIAFFTIFLWRSTEKLWKASEAQSVKMETSINAMTSIATSMEKNVIRLEAWDSYQRAMSQRNARAYITVKPISCTFNYASAGYVNYEIKLLVFNNGQTFANDIEVTIVNAIFKFPTPYDAPMNFEREPYKIPSVPFKLGYNFPSKSITPIPVTRFTEIQKNASTEKLHIFGSVFYTDVFGVRQYTNFCWYAWWNEDGKFEPRFFGLYNDAT